ncbi:MAG TPA: Hpt domain-containing protein, partial [Ktedonobacterales bacterium]|nr:Hpt domain-containing protein [Ktedonobacterales bacterium]
MGENFDKTAIMESFLDEVNAYLPEIEANLDRLQQAPDDLRALQETYRRTHTISGSASMMEFQALAHVAQGMEEILDEALERQEPLSAPTIALLRRSSGRLSRIVEHIREEKDDSALIAEDDQDRAARRGPASLASNTPAGLAGSGASSSPAAGAEPPEWLAAFATPAANGSGNGSSPASVGSTPAALPGQHGGAQTGADLWNVSLSNLPTGAAPAIGLPTGSQPSTPQAAQQATPQATQGSATFAQSPGAGAGAPPGTSVPSTPGAEAFPDPWGRSQAQASVFDPFAPPSPTGQAPGAPQQPSSTPGAAAAQGVQGDISAVRTSPSLGGSSGVMAAPGQMPVSKTIDATAATTAFDELRADEEAVRRQVATLRTIVAMMREAAQAMEDERAELGAFLDGSGDALARLEDWVGQQMGLDLR